MKVHCLRLKNIRCFDDTGDLLFSPGLNIFVGKNNSGKSTILQAICGLQINPFDADDVRPSPLDLPSYSEIMLSEIESHRVIHLNRNTVIRRKQLRLHIEATIIRVMTPT
jgi:predicted ATP-dependent endonuclease of OLD family